MQSSGQACFTLVSPQGSTSVLLPMIGQHNVANGLAAAAMAMQVGATLDEVVNGLEAATNVTGRVEAIDLTDNIRLIDDSYNASVPAMNAAVDLLANYHGKRWLISFRWSFGNNCGINSSRVCIGDHGRRVRDGNFIGYFTSGFISVSYTHL